MQEERGGDWRRDPESRLKEEAGGDAGPRREGRQAGGTSSKGGDAPPSVGMGYGDQTLPTDQEPGEIGLEGAKTPADGPPDDEARH